MDMEQMMQALGGSPEDLDFKPPLDNGQLGPVTEVLRTPEDRFANLPDFPFEPNYFQSKSHGDIRIHYLDEGPKDAAETIFFLHGEPTWCYLYRFMIPIFAEAGYRVIAPDLVGFGKSDKPTKRTDHSYERHVDWISELVVGLGLDNITPFLQDWGGLIGLRVVARFPEKFLRVVVSNTGLPRATDADVIPDAFRAWAGVISQRMPNWGMLISQMCLREISGDESSAYEAPFPSEEYKVASRELPRMVVQFPDHGSLEENRGAWRRVFMRWQKPFLTLFGSADPQSKGEEQKFIDAVPGAQGQPHEIVEGAGHFVQEDKPQEMASKMMEWMKSTPVPTNQPTVIAEI